MVYLDVSLLELTYKRANSKQVVFSDIAILQWCRMQMVSSRLLARAKCLYGGEWWGRWGTERGMTRDRGHELNLTCDVVVKPCEGPLMTAVIWVSAVFPHWWHQCDIIYLLYFFKDFSIRIFLQVHWVHVMWPGCLTHFRTVRQRRADTVDAGWTVTGSLLHSRADINTNTDNIHRWTIVHVEQQQQLWSPHNAS